MLESIDESKNLLVDTEKVLQLADKLLADSYKSLKNTNELKFESHKNLIESKNLLQKSHKGDGHCGETMNSERHIIRLLDDDEVTDRKAK